MGGSNVRAGKGVGELRRGREYVVTSSNWEKMKCQRLELQKDLKHLVKDGLFLQVERTFDTFCCDRHRFLSSSLWVWKD